jgi:hypothetical protein
LLRVCCRPPPPGSPFTNRRNWILVQNVKQHRCYTIAVCDGTAATCRRPLLSTAAAPALPNTSHLGAKPNGLTLSLIQQQQRCTSNNPRLAAPALAHALCDFTRLNDSGMRRAGASTR